MEHQRPCPYCGWLVTTRYLDFCTIPLRYPKRWSAQCYKCNCSLEATPGWEVLTCIASLLGTVAICALFVMPWFKGMHRPSGGIDAGVILATAIALTISYFFTGLVRFMLFPYAKIS